MSNWYKKSAVRDRYFMGTLIFKVFVPRTENFDTDRQQASQQVQELGLRLIREGIDVTNTDVTAMET